MRLVLDSNVWLDWLFFDDPGVAGIKRAHQEGRIEIVVDAACRDELVRVLGYRQFALDPPGQASALAEADRLWTFLDELDYPPSASLPFCPFLACPAIPLPKANSPLTSWTFVTLV